MRLVSVWRFGNVHQGWRDPYHATAGARQMGGVREPCGMRGGRQGFAPHPVFPHASEASPQNVLSQSHSGLLGEQVAEATRRKAGDTRDFRERDRRGQMIVHVFDRTQDPFVAHHRRLRVLREQLHDSACLLDDRWPATPFQYRCEQSG